MSPSPTFVFQSEGPVLFIAHALVASYGFLPEVATSGLVLKPGVLGPT